MPDSTMAVELRRILRPRRCCTCDRAVIAIVVVIGIMAALFMTYFMSVPAPSENKKTVPKQPDSFIADDAHQNPTICPDSDQDEPPCLDDATAESTTTTIPDRFKGSFKTTSSALDTDGIETSKSSPSRTDAIITRSGSDPSTVQTTKSSPDTCCLTTAPSCDVMDPVQSGAADADRPLESPTALKHDDDSGAECSNEALLGVVGRSVVNESAADEAVVEELAVNPETATWCLLDLGRGLLVFAVHFHFVLHQVAYNGVWVMAVSCLPPIVMGHRAPEQAQQPDPVPGQERPVRIVPWSETPFATWLRELSQPRMLLCLVVGNAILGIMGLRGWTTTMAIFVDVLPGPWTYLVSMAITTSLTPLTLRIFNMLAQWLWSWLTSLSLLPA